MKEKILRNIVEVITERELDFLLSSGKKLKAYIGFEPSGFVHLGTGVLWPLKLRDLEECGIHTVVLLADWHAYINDKLGGDLEKIKICGEYMRECFRAMGTNAQFIFASEIVGDKDYWEKVIRVAKKTTLRRAKRAMTIMGRREDEAELDSSKIIYPFMQVADIFHLDVDIALGGMDQRHAHMLARDVAEKLKYRKVVALHGPLLTGLQGGGRMDPVEAKMSKSKPKSTIFVHDSEEEIRKKVRKAYCPEGVVEGNPILDIVRYIIFPYYTDKFVVERDEKYGGDVEFNSYEELENAFASREIHPLDLKNSVANYLINILSPIRKKMENNPLLEEMMKIAGEMK